MRKKKNMTIIAIAMMCIMAFTVEENGICSLASSTWDGYVCRWQHYRKNGKQHSDLYDNWFVHSTAVGYADVWGREYVTNRSGLVEPNKTSYSSSTAKASGNRAWYNRYT